MVIKKTRLVSALNRVRGVGLFLLGVLGITACKCDKGGNSGNDDNICGGQECIALEPVNKAYRPHIFSTSCDITQNAGSCAGGVHLPLSYAFDCGAGGGAAPATAASLHNISGSPYMPAYKVDETLCVVTTPEGATDVLSAGAVSSVRGCWLVCRVTLPQLAQNKIKVRFQATAWGALL